MSEFTISSTPLNHEAFILEKDNFSIAYFPLKRKAFEITEAGKNLLINFYKKGELNQVIEEFLRKNNLLNPSKEPINKNDPMKPISLNLALTSGCNLKCIYCYADAGYNARIMPLETAKKAIDTVVGNIKEANLDILRISFLGGGETLTVYKLLKEIIKYTDSFSQLKKKFSIVVNGTLITKEIAKFLKENNFHVTVSLDGPEDIQNKQRPKINGKGSFEDVLTGMKLLKEEGIDFGIRSTITTINGERITELLDIAKEVGCSIKLEPITPTGRGESLDIDPKERFISMLEKAQLYGKKVGVDVRSSYKTNLSLKTQYCGGNGNMCCVLPNGLISSCSRITKEQDKLFDVYITGEVTSDRMYLSNEKIKVLKSLTSLNSTCENCFAKWHCAGGCYSTKLLCQGTPEEHCTTMRYFVWQDILEQLMKGGEKND